MNPSFHDFIVIQLDGRWKRNSIELWMIQDFSQISSCENIFMRNNRTHKKEKYRSENLGLRWGVALKNEFIVLTCRWTTHAEIYELRRELWPPCTLRSYQFSSIVNTISQLSTFIVCDYELRMKVN